MTIRVIQGDALEVLATLPDESVHCVVTSPPYWGLRDYGVDGQIGLEVTPEVFVEALVGVLREVRRVLRADGTLWLNLGDTYIGGRNGGIGGNTKLGSQRNHLAASQAWHAHGGKTHRRCPGFKPKDLVGIPWRVALALHADGWWLRSDIVWSKPSPMPESVSDRPTRSHEYVFLLARSHRYYYDAAAIVEPVTGGAHPRGHGINPKARLGAKDQEREASGEKTSVRFGRGAGWRSKQNPSFSAAVRELVETRNRRSVWTIAQEPFSQAHFATFPTKLVEPCILAGCPPDGTVLDPFAGAGTTGLVADRLGRDAILIELNPEYCEMARRRIEGDAPLFTEVETA